MSKVCLDLVGSDMEVFLRNNLTGAPVPVCGLIGGTKQEPLPVLGGGGYAVQEDNVMLEFNIPPAKDVTSFVTSFDNILKYIETTVASQGLHIDIAASMKFSEQDLASPQAQHIGCEPDFNAYTRKMRRLSVARMEGMRCAGGHVHLGMDEETSNDNPFGDVSMPNKHLIVRALDLHLGLGSLFFDEDSVRRGLYGRAGMFRPKPYGLEYRSLSNAWIRSKELMEWVYEGCHRALEFYNKGNTTADSVESIINDSNKLDAKMLMGYYNIPLPKGVQFA